MCLPNILSPVFMFVFIFHCRSFSTCWPLAFLIVSQPLWIFMFFFLQNSSLLFSNTRSRSFSVIHVSVNIKDNVEKDTTVLLFFLSKSPGDHAISFQIKPWVAFGLPYLLIELFYIGIPVVRTVGRSVGVWSRDYQIFSDGWFTTFFLPMVFRCARFARESSAIRQGKLREITKCLLTRFSYYNITFYDSQALRPEPWTYFKKRRSFLFFLVAHFLLLTCHIKIRKKKCILCIYKV